MKAAPIKELKSALAEQNPLQLKAIILRLARFKKENKELLTYLLFASQDEEGYIKQIKEEITEQFAQISSYSFYIVKKQVRKILRQTKTAIRYSGKKETEVELLLHFISELKSMQPSYRRSSVLRNLFQRQVNGIEKILDGLHEDLQYDYQLELENVLGE
jgi:predicted nucleotide-binding protein (sugar kinase/HSP70/actin superfamily)